MSGKKVRFLWILTLVFFNGCLSSQQSRQYSSFSDGNRRIKSNEALVVDSERCEVRLKAVVQKTDAPRMEDWAQVTPALLGSKGGKCEKFFVFLTDARVTEVHEALLELGARSRVVYKVEEAVKHKGLRPDNTPSDYMQGDPVQIFVEWKEGGQIKRMAYEDFFLEKLLVGESETTKPWTPHFVFHGSGALNNKKTGCIACTHDCPGGIIGNNQYPLIEPLPMLRADWQKLPKPGTKVIIIIRPVASGIIVVSEK